MTENEYMEIVNPNDYQEINGYNAVQIGDFIGDHDGHIMSQVINKIDGDLICRKIGTSGKTPVSELDANHLGYRYFRLKPTKKVPLARKNAITEEEELQIAECLRLAGVQLNEYIFDRESSLYDENYIDYFSTNMELITDITKISKYDAMYFSNEQDSPLLFIFLQSYNEAMEQNPGWFKVNPARIISRKVKYEMVDYYLKNGAIIAHRK